MNKKQYIRKRRTYLFIIYFLAITNLYLLGATMNYIVIKGNDWRMPVLTTYNTTAWDSHSLNYISSDEVNYPYFADNIYIDHAWWSIGDIFMLIALFDCMLFVIIMICYIIIGIFWGKR